MAPLACAPLAPLFPLAPDRVLEEGTNGAGVELMLGELSHFADSFPDTTTAAVVHEHFTQNAKLPAVLVMRGGQLLGVISRSVFFQLLSRTNGIVVYHPRPISLMLDHAKMEMLLLPSKCLVSEAVSRCLQRPQEYLYEPLVVSNGDSYWIVDFHTLIIAQSELLHQTTRCSEQQQLLLERKNREILDSIIYAQRIQKSILREPGSLAEWGLNYFLLFKPRDIVSGDFFYVAEYEEKLVVAVVDCTGHGVPGAFMSLIGHKLLDEIVTSRGVTEPSQILSSLHEGIRRSLNQGHDSVSRRDGMDACLCVIHPKERKLYYSGAKRPLYMTVAGGNETQVIGGDHCGIGGWQREPGRFFSTQEIRLEAGQTFYLTTDGYADQHSDENRKLGSTRLKALLQEVRLLPLAGKKERLESALVSHQGRQSQRDDITIMGLEWL